MQIELFHIHLLTNIVYDSLHYVYNHVMPDEL